jgi:4-amino-4-deoxy-L-arabinose transferase-like glycosyltransferase
MSSAELEADREHTAARWLTVPISNTHLWVVLGIAVAMSFFVNLGGVPLFDLDEGAFSEATREMFERSDFISPYLNGKPRFDKPILIYWLQALSVSLFGMSEFAFRLPSALCATLWVMVVYAFVRQILDPRTALVAAIITATAAGVSVIGKAATADALLNLLLAAALLEAFRYYRERKVGQIYRVFLWAGLGVLAKGPIAVLIPFAVSLAFFVLRGEIRAWFGAAFNPVGLLILAAVALPWYVAQYWREGDAFIQGFFLRHNVGRFENPMEGHSGSLLYYVPIALLLVLPYTSILLKALTRIRDAARDDLTLYFWLWFGFVFVLFSLSATKLPHYLLYGVTPLFILMARYRDQLNSRLWAFLPPLLFLGILWLLPALTDLIQPHVHDAYVKALLTESDQAFGRGYQVLLGMATLATVALALIRYTPIWHRLLISGILSVTVLSLAVIPALARLQQEPIKQAALVAKREGYRVVMWKLRTPSFNVYSRSLTERRRPLPGEIVLTKAHYLREFPDYTVLFQRGGIVLARMRPSGVSE